ncbi:LysE family transporter [Robbsia andropogonis]|uniref:LysE family transporter n=1 Tax=Robbsia andropogonis TaxID=28092 RepID=UPI003D1BC268
MIGASIFGLPSFPCSRLTNRRESKQPPHWEFELASYFLATFFLTLSNPITILSFIAMFAALASTAGFHGDREWSTVMTMVSGVFVGSAVWWLFLSILTSTLRRAMPSSWIRRLSLMSAIGIAAFGAFEMVTGTSSFIEVF